MKNTGLKRLAVYTAALGLVFSSCTRYSSDFDDTNVNPGVTGSPILSALLTNVEAGLGNYAAGNALSLSASRPGMYCQYFSETQYPDASLYALPQFNFEGIYSGSLNDLQNIINTNTNNNMSAVSKILKSFIYSTVTDAWGDVPYSEALTGNPYPKFDAQENIYKGMISELTAAIAQFDANSAITGDIVYGGSVAKWKKYANSLRMRLALQLSKKYPSAGGYAATEFNAALNDPAGIITDNADNFMLSYPGGAFKSPWWNQYDGRKDLGESETMTNLMSSLADTRQSVFGGATEQGSPAAGWNVSSSTGVPYGRNRTFIDAWTGANPNWARVLRGDYRTETGKVVMLGAAEVFLMRAEAADRGWTAENMSSMYTQGINASFAQWGLAAPAASYFTQGGVALAAAPGTAANIKNLAIQQFIAAYPNGLRGWNIWRRTGFPTLTPAPDATNSSHQIVRRFTYGQNSYGSNGDNVAAAAAALPGGDTQDSKVWWDQ